MSAPPRLVLEGVHKSFGRKVVLDGIDLTVAAHEVVCLIGRSGCGKSTLLRCVNLLERIDAGRILLDGDEVSRRGVDPNDVRRRVAIVFQGLNLFPHMRVIDNVTLGPVRAHKVPRDQARAKAMELLDRFELADRSREYPDRLSGGQQQRVAIVRALMTDPDLLLLDEVTSALDPVLVAEVLAVLRDLASQGVTMVLATHEMGFARDVAHRVAYLHQGRILECAPPADLFGSPQRPETREFLRRVTEAGRL